MPIAKKIVLKKRLKTELAHVRTGIGFPGSNSESLLVNESTYPVKGHKTSGKACSSDQEQGTMSRKRKLPEVSKQQKEDGNLSNDEEFVIENSEAVSSVTAAFKGDYLGLRGENVKSIKMDVTKVKQCYNVLMKLMKHKNGWVFSQPVDPVQLNIPDYFSIIKKPMDLGTIKYKLERKCYLSTHEFAADVRLTFSNAVRYNPPENPVHGMAKNLKKIFNASWESLEFKWRKECSVSAQQLVRPTIHKTPKQVLLRAPSCNSSSISSKSLTAADKLKLQHSLMSISRRNIPPRLLKFLRRAHLLEQSEDRISVDVDSLEETTMWELHEIIRSCEDVGSTKPASLMKSSHDLIKECYKGEIRGTCGSGACTISSACENDNQHCIDVDSDGSSVREDRVSRSIPSNLDGGSISGMQENLDYDTLPRMGTAVVDLDNAQDRPNSSGLPAASPLKGIDFSYEEQLSPMRALRAAMLKSRFADTIWKAQQKTLLNHGDKGDPARMQHEREKLEKQQQEEKARIESQVKAAEAAVRMKAEAELRMQQARAEADVKIQRERAEAELKVRREREREAARLALQKMEKTVDIDENSRFFKDLENLGYSQPVYLDMPDEIVANFMDAVEQQCVLGNPLAKLGLFMKEDDLDEDLDDWISPAGDDDREEGEIGSL